MIHGEPDVIERDGEQVLVDGNGDELVCRNDGERTSEKYRIYHRVDAETYAEDGDIKPDCGHTLRTDRSWILRRRKTLESNWGGCSYSDCYGDYCRSEQTEKHGDYLAAKLREMTVEEFDAAVQRRGADD